MKFKIMAILMVGLLLLNGCGKASEIPAKTALSTPKSTMKTLTIYSIDSDTMSLIPVVVKKEEKTLTAEYITYLVTQNLEDEDVKFIKNFILSSGSLKEIAKEYGVTYPTVRLRLDRLIQSIEMSESREQDHYVSLVKRLAINDKIDFETAKILISEYRKEVEGK